MSTKDYKQKSFALNPKFEIKKKDYQNFFFSELFIKY